MKLSLFYGKRVESTTGKTGYVISVNAYCGKLECLTCADDDENEFIVDMKNVISVKEKIIFEDRESAINSAIPIRLGCASYDERGMFLGNLTECNTSGLNITNAKIGKKNYPASELICGDIIIVKDLKKVKSDVKKDGRIIIKKGSVLSPEIIEKAVLNGEFVQTTMKTI